jgi:hypothetical protein
MNVTALTNGSTPRPRLAATSRGRSLVVCAQRFPNHILLRTPLIRHSRFPVFSAPANRIDGLAAFSRCNPRASSSMLHCGCSSAYRLRWQWRDGNLQPRPARPPAQEAASEAPRESAPVTVGPSPARLRRHDSGDGTWYYNTTSHCHCTISLTKSQGSVFLPPVKARLQTQSGKDNRRSSRCQQPRLTPRPTDFHLVYRITWEKDTVVRQDSRGLCFSVLRSSALRGKPASPGASWTPGGCNAPGDGGPEHFWRCPPEI